MGATVVLALLIAIPAALAAKAGNSPNAKLCQKGGWQTLYTRDGTPFGSETQCASYGAQGGQIINQTALACLDDGWQELGTSSGPFTSEQECVDQAVAGGALVTFVDLSIGAEETELGCQTPWDPDYCTSNMLRVYNGGSVNMTVNVTLSGTYQPDSFYAEVIPNVGSQCTFADDQAGNWSETCTGLTVLAGGSTFLAHVIARNGASQAGSASVTSRSPSLPDPNSTNDTFTWNFTAPAPG
jgi:hypothetical protein